MGFMDGFTSDGTVDMKHTEYYNLMKESLTIVIGLTVTENYYRQKEKSGGPLPPVG